MNSANIEALLGAVAPLHEAPQDSGAWHAALVSLARAIPCEQGALFERFGRGPTPVNFGLAVGTDAQFLGEYQREYHRIDPFTTDDVVSRLHHLGRAALSSEVLPDIDLQVSAFYTDFLTRYGDLFHGVGGSFPVADNAWAHVWLLRPRGRDFDENERRRMDVFFAHARAALRQRRWLAQIELERDAALSWMDCWSDATFVLDAQGAVVISNLMGERMLHAGDCLALRNGRLRPARSSDLDWVGTAVRAVISEYRERGTDATRCLNVPGRNGQGTLNAVLTTLPGAHGRAAGAQPRVALILRDLRQALPQYGTEQLRELFGFTAAETRVANALLAGASVEEISLATQVRRDTVRAHVKRMLAKTGTRRQSDLQKLLVKALPNLRSLHTPPAPDASLLGPER
jgi:DNA-binding CsgD family transcriptional regulator